MTARVMLMAGLLFLSATMAGSAVQAESKSTPGEAAYKKQCTSCHTGLVGMSTIAPDLHGVMGRKAGSLPNYKYTDALKNADFTWTPEKMSEWLKSPHGVAAETSMIYAGEKDAKVRAEIVEFVGQLKAK